MTVPRSMVLSFVINGVLAFAFLLGLLFGVPDIENALNSPTKSPIVAIMYQTFQSKIAATAVVGLLVLVSFCVLMGMVASTSRLTWAFARDNGLPFSRTIAYVRLTDRNWGLLLNLARYIPVTRSRSMPYY